MRTWIRIIKYVLLSPACQRGTLDTMLHPADKLLVRFYKCPYTYGVHLADSSRIVATLALISREVAIMLLTTLERPAWGHNPISHSHKVWLPYLWPVNFHSEKLYLSRIVYASTYVENFTLCLSLEIGMRKGIFQFKIVLVLFALCNKNRYRRCMYKRNEKLVEKPFSTGKRQELKSGNMKVPRKFLLGFYT